MARGAALSLPLLLLPFGLLPLAAAAEEDVDEPRRGWVNELRGGVLAHDVSFLWSNFSEESGVAGSVEIVWYRRGIDVLWGSLRPNLGATVNLEGDTSKLYAGIVWEYRSRTGLFVELGVGPAVHDGKLDTSDDDRKELGSRVLIRTALDLGYEITAHHRLMVSFDHISNAGLASPNEGLDTLGVRYGYRF